MAVPATSERLGVHAPHHVLAVPASEEALREQTSAFVAGGLAAGEQVSYFDDGTADGLLERLGDDGVAVDPPMRTGQLRIVPAEATRAALEAPLDDLSALLHGAVDEAVASGWRGLRFTGQLSHGLTRHGGTVLPEIDAVVDRVVRERPARVLCVYDQARYPAWLIDRMRSQHASTDEAPAVFDDTLLRITREPGGVVRLAGQIDHSNRQEVRRVLEPMQEKAVRAAHGPSELILDLASLRFCDVATAVNFVHAAEELSSSHRLVLSGVRPVLVRLLERCGAGVAPQLDVRPR